VGLLFELDQPQGFVHAAGYLGARYPLRTFCQRQRHVLEDRQMRPDSIGLKDHPEPALLGRYPSRRIVRTNQLIGDANLASLRGL